jgi:hypothetical protein
MAASAESDFSFDAAEVDVLVDEVQEAPTSWQPQEASSIWQTDMGSPDDAAAEPWGAGSEVAIESLESMESMESMDTLGAGVAETLEDEAPAPAPFQDEPDLESWAGPTPQPSFELDRGFDPEWGSEPAPPAPLPEPVAAAWEEPAPLAARQVEAPGAMAAEVLLTDVAAGASLFADPDLEVTRLSPGGTREISVPVEMRDAGTTRRFVLTVRLSLTPAD